MISFDEVPCVHAKQPRCEECGREIKVNEKLYVVATPHMCIIDHESLAYTGHLIFKHHDKGVCSLGWRDMLERWRSMSEYDRLELAQHYSYEMRN